MSKRNSSALFMVGLAMGILAGSTVALLLAARSQREIREISTEHGLELKNRAEDVVQRAQQIANETLSKVQEAAKKILVHDPGIGNLDAPEQG